MNQIKWLYVFMVAAWIIPGYVIVDVYQNQGIGQACIYSLAFTGAFFLSRLLAGFVMSKWQ